MTDQRKLEGLKAAREARASSGSGSPSRWEAVQSALRRYLASESYSRRRERQGAERDAGSDTAPESTTTKRPGGHRT